MREHVYFYDVTGGRCSAILMSWDRVVDATVGYPDAKFGKFSTLEETEKFTREQDVEVHSNEALQETLKYSGNSQKKFSSCEKAVKFLDRHDRRKMPFEEESEPEDVEVVEITDDIVVEETIDESCSLLAT
ncbi:hypothetical protein F441_20604 [Phytophthora nicotianae CJ01A1]|uniref:Ribonuclease H1 N-terminal domain-containing protein n=4 Tax=Phytophthora nicotianae TaxID=4792 RepID=W2QVI0_PHYN3|nr:hypothetical protein PPTG_21804 [Phytophthora nicotianae INRA-310]ETK72841.1 hypothetical protein L915_20152 [Phytophthora nicotianae]ETO61223.1 hypothetical protein F444_20751 [Phytophthora nicotianae P1976]ETP02309.1 hypothetical protein F441_20604 [Phytophthora nicotianae CJ01A1]ETL26292.1 hypothetical protein L916_20021 [Phytophthora nicotianae]ETL79509.1 hypothetical protein L917_19884 [Phytophthora nicotianae]